VSGVWCLVSGVWCLVSGVARYLICSFLLDFEGVPCFDFCR
jgi:hypothetical protein